MAITAPTRSVLEDRIARLVQALAQSDTELDTILLVGRVNQYYFAGTVQDGLLAIRRDASATYFARKSFERARQESPLSDVRPMGSYRDMLAVLPRELGRVGLETEIVPLAMLERLRKHFSIESVVSVDKAVAALRSIKSRQELELMAFAGERHCEVMECAAPALLEEGISEADFAARLYAAMVKLGHHGVSRFSMFQMEIVAGQFGFGVNSLYPTNFDGPGGMLGNHPAVPLLGSRERRLKQGDLVFVDTGFGVCGYHSDKTQVYSFGAEPPPAAVDAHRACRNVLRKAARLLRPGVLASDVYTQAVADLPPPLSRHFMGYGEHRVKFLGHGVGLQIDEAPIIMAGNATPLAEGMVIALEPKCGVEGVGMVGVEETYAITADGAVCLTGGDRDIMVVEGLEPPRRGSALPGDGRLEGPSFNELGIAHSESAKR